MRCGDPLWSPLHRKVVPSSIAFIFDSMLSKPNASYYCACKKPYKTVTTLSKHAKSCAAAKTVERAAYAGCNGDDNKLGESDEEDASRDPCNIYPMEPVGEIAPQQAIWRATNTLAVGLNTILTINTPDVTKNALLALMLDAQPWINNNSFAREEWAATTTMDGITAFTATPTDIASVLRVLHEVSSNYHQDL